jgi:hypothetical protein
MHHKRSLYRPIGRLALHGAAEFLWHFATVFPRTVTKCHNSNVQRQHPRWGAIARQSMVVLLTLRAECSLLARNPASSTPYLPVTTHHTFVLPLLTPQATMRDSQKRQGQRAWLLAASSLLLSTGSAAEPNLLTDSSIEAVLYRHTWEVELQGGGKQTHTRHNLAKIISVDRKGDAKRLKTEEPGTREE